MVLEMFWVVSAFPSPSSFKGPGAACVPSAVEWEPWTSGPQGASQSQCWREAFSHPPDSRLRHLGCSGATASSALCPASVFHSACCPAFASSPGLLFHPSC